MKKFHKIFPLIFILCLFTYCKTNDKTVKSQETNPEKKLSRQLILGKGGGFTGKYEEFILKSSGIVVQKDPMDSSSTHIIAELEEQKRDSIFKQADELHFPDNPFNHPGNMTYYLQYHRDNTVHKIKWGSNQHAPPKEIKAFFDSLYSQFEKLK